MDGLQEVKNNIEGTFKRRNDAVYALCLYYAGMALNYFRSVQPSTPNSSGRFWHNATAQAAARVFSGARREDENNVISWFMAHGVQYGVYLELANDRRNEALRPIINRFAGRFFEDLKKIYGDAA